MGDEIMRLADAMEERSRALVEEGNLNFLRVSAQGQVQLMAIESARKAFDYARERLDNVNDRLEELSNLIREHIAKEKNNDRNGGMDIDRK